MTPCARAEFMFVAVGKVAFIEQSDIGQTFAAHDHERPMRNINAFDIGGRWTTKLV